MRRLVITALIALLVTPVFAAEPPKTEEEKTLYAVGLVIAQRIAVFNLNNEELEMVKLGFADATSGKKPLVDMETYNKKIQEFATVRRTAKLTVATKDLLEKAAKEKGAVKTDSGMIFLSQVEGSGANPVASNTVKVNYRGTLADGTEFDSSYKRDQPAEFPLGNVIKCWTEGLQKMKAGGKAKLVCPPAIAYGENSPSPLIPPNSTLVFEVELIEIKK